MRREVRRTLEMAARVQAFVQAKPFDDPTSQAVVQAFAGKVAEAALLATQQQEGQLEARRANARRRSLRRVLHTRLLRQLSTAAESAAEQDPQLIGKYPLPRFTVPYHAFLTRARAMMATAQADRETLVKHGMTEPLFAELTTVMAEFERQTLAAIDARRQHVAARGDLEAVVDTILRQVALLDGMYRSQFKDDPNALAGWESVRSVVRSRPKPMPAAGENAPSDPGEPLPGDGLPNAA